MCQRICFAMIFALGYVWVAVMMGFASEPLTITSPDGNISISFELKADPQPYLPGERAYYGVSYKGRPILGDSPLGLDFKGAQPLGQDFEIIGTDRQSQDSTWENPLGAKRIVPDHYNQLTVSLRERHVPSRRLDLIFRAYNEGVAFRYFLPKQEGLDLFVISSENTGFYFTGNSTAYALRLNSFTTPYEAHFDPVKLDQIKPESIIGLPLLVEIPQGPWVALLEADLSDYAGMYMSGVSGTPNALVSKLSPVPTYDPSAMGPYVDVVRVESDVGSTSSLVKQKLILSPPGKGQQLLPPLSAWGQGPGSEDVVVGRTPKATPWRVMLINPRAGGLIESNYLILNLNPPSVLADTTWIQPGKAAWDWWSGRYARNVNFEPGMNTATMMHYIDFAAEHHLEYMMIDGNWSPFTDITRSIPEIDLPTILAHAQSKGVKVLLWMLWTTLREQVDVAFPLYEKWGVAGVKVDFMDRDDQEMVNWYEEISRKAAEHHLVVDFHGAFKPTGLRRTYPNVLNREGVMGLEYNKAGYLATPEHAVTIPFTRMLAGPMDNTPGSFHNATRDQFKPRVIEPMSQGTRASQLAMYVVYEMPLAMLADYPEAYEGLPEFEFIERVPTVWDDTKVLNGEPAEFVTIARQHGDAWYVGSITNWDARDLEIPMSFLGKRKYQAQIFADGVDADKTPTSVTVTKKLVSGRDTLQLHLAPGGGSAVILTPAVH
ncbi:MAG TPA: glycoside hydrolase family 97 protein [Terriglobia bacterium]|nr:glycoside hydrolase family 97 protein [Terriglobia bacterium]